jgi:glycosyltransferase involved in cell wall biosynthesis
MRGSEPPRVLHVLHALNRGGAERWLVHVLRNTPQGSWSTDFLVHTAEPAAYDAEVRALGGRIVVGPKLGEPLRYPPRLRHLLHRHGPYRVVHSHLHLFSGVVLRAANQAGVPLRIVQSHTAQTESGLSRRLYRMIMRTWIGRHATHFAAVSEPAAAALFGSDRHAPPVQIVDCALDFSPYARLPGRERLKELLGLPLDRMVIGHVGRFDPVKNHRFVVSVFAEILRLGVNAQLLLVGTGPLKTSVRRQAEELGVSGRCVFAGGHDEVAPYFGAMDLMLFPSLQEGLGLAALEAQAADVPVLASTGVPSAAAVVPGRLHRHGLEEGPAAWARAARLILASSTPPDRAASATALMESRFGVAHSVRQLSRLYGESWPAGMRTVEARAS